MLKLKCRGIPRHFVYLLILAIVVTTLSSKQNLIFAPLKKIAVIILLFAYSFSTMGATVATHYCMNEFVGVSLGYNGDDNCGKCGMKEAATACCKDESKFFKLKTKHNKPGPSHSFSPSLKIIFSPCSMYAHLLQAAACNPQAAGVYHLPPLCGPPQLHKFYCVFLI